MARRKPYRRPFDFDKEDEPHPADHLNRKDPYSTGPRYAKSPDAGWAADHPEPPKAEPKAESQTNPEAWYGHVWKTSDTQDDFVCTKCGITSTQEGALTWCQAGARTKPVLPKPESKPEHKDDGVNLVDANGNFTRRPV